MKRHALALASLLAGLLAGCATVAPAAKAPAAGPDAVVARFAGGEITAAELDAATYDNRKETLEQLALQRVLEARAKAEGLGVEALYRREVASKLRPPTDAEVKAFYDEAASHEQLPPLDEIRDQVVQAMGRNAQQKAQQDFLEKLKADSGLKILLLAPRFPVAAVGPAKGPDQAPITIVEFSDFECPFCSKGEVSIREVLKAYPGQVRVVFRDFPLPMHPHAEKAAEAAHCAGDQGKYWELHEVLFANQQNLAASDLSRHAQAIGLDAEKFSRCLDSGAKAGLVEGSIQAGKAVGVTGTPAFFINGIRLTGAQPFSEFKAVIDQELAKR
jgi:protein-disulfide isomerase